MGEKREAYLEKLRARMDEWNAEIDVLSAKAHQAKAEMKIEYLNELEDLRAKRRDLQQKIVEMEQASENAWQDLKQGLENSWTILKKSLTRAKSEFEKGYKEGKKEE